MCIHCDFVLRSEWSLVDIPGTMGVGPNKLLVVKGVQGRVGKIYTLTGPRHKLEVHLIQRKALTRN